MSEEIKYEAVFGEQSLLDGAPDDIVAVRLNNYNSLSYGYLTKEKLDALSVMDLKAIPIVAMRRIIKTPVWTVADQKVGRLPEVGAKAVQCQDYCIVDILSIRNGYIVVCNSEIDDSRPTTFEIKRFLELFKPIETTEERELRLEDEFFEQVKSEWMNANAPQKTSSLFELGVRAAYRRLSGELQAPEKE